MALRDDIDAYLADQHCTLWGRAFDIIESDSKAKAVEWFASQVEGLAEFVASPEGG